MNICICDDDALEIKRISSLIDEFNTQNDINLTYDSYSNAIDMVSDITIGSYDLIFLDILMPGLTGIDAAKEIRKTDQVVEIVFLTSSPEFALESYSVNAKNYLLKPALKAKVFSILNQLLSEKNAPFEGLLIKNKTCIAKIPFAKIAYIEVISKKLIFHLIDGEQREISGSLTDYEEELEGRFEFLKVHRSFWVNLWHMSELTGNTFIAFNGTIIPISRLLLKDVRQRYMDHLFIEKEV
ncbi:MAG: LytTR family DNA-binding domain-containing protein [Anaerovoracaceae bacterium]